MAKTNIREGDLVVVKRTSRPVGTYGYEATLAMVGQTCKVLYVSDDDEGIHVAAPDGKSGYFFGYTEVKLKGD